MNRSILLVGVFRMAFLISHCPQVEPAGKQRPAHRTYPIAAVWVYSLRVFPSTPILMNYPPVATPPSTIKVNPSNSILMRNEFLIYWRVINARDNTALPYPGGNDRKYKDNGNCETIDLELVSFRKIDSSGDLCVSAIFGIRIFIDRSFIV